MEALKAPESKNVEDRRQLGVVDQLLQYLGFSPPPDYSRPIILRDHSPSYEDSDLARDAGLFDIPERKK